MVVQVFYVKSHVLESRHVLDVINVKHAMSVCVFNNPFDIEQNIEDDKLMVDADSITVLRYIVEVIKERQAQRGRDDEPCPAPSIEMVGYTPQCTYLVTEH